MKTRPGGFTDDQHPLKSLDFMPLDHAKSGSSSVNKSATECKTGTRLTRGRSRRVRFEIVDALDRIHGPFPNFAAAQEHLKKRFRFQAQDDERAGRYPTGWDIRVAEPGTPNIRALSLRRLRQVLDYDPETGVLSWRVRLSPRCKIGQPAGVIKQHGYRKISIDGRNYPASNLAWFHFYGVLPEGIVDHKDLDKSNDRIGNLREATSTENALNRARNSLNTTGFKGVARYNERYTKAKYRAHIRAKGKRIFLGLFHTPEEAYAAYSKAATELHGEFARLN